MVSTYLGGREHSILCLGHQVTSAVPMAWCSGSYTNKQTLTLTSSSGRPLPLEALLAGGIKLFYYVNTQKFYPASCVLHLLRICLILHDWYEIALIVQIAFPERSFPETYYRACWPCSLAKGLPAVGLYSNAVFSQWQSGRPRGDRWRKCIPLGIVRLGSANISCWSPLWRGVGVMMLAVLGMAMRKWAGMRPSPTFSLFSHFIRYARAHRDNLNALVKKKRN